MRGRRTVTFAVAGLLAVALLAASAASAGATSVLCKKNVATCPAESIWPTGSEFTVATKALNVFFETAPSTGQPVTNKQRCSEASSSIVTEGTTSGNVFGTWRNLTFAKCAAETISGIYGVCGGGAEARNLPWKMVFEAGATPASNAITVTSSGKGNPTIRVTCTPGGVPTVCTYSAASLKLNMPVGAEEQPQIWVQSAVMTLVEGGFWCNTEKALYWQANYNSVSPAAYLTH
jgi:hypothetical protein